MDIAKKIINAFPADADDPAIPDDFITAHPSLMEIDGQPDLLRYVPAYMLWCIRNKDNYDQLVTDYTINALAVYGRSGHADNSHLNFRWRCNAGQIAAVVAFLNWCLENLSVVDDAQIKRSLKRWSLA